MPSTPEFITLPDGCRIEIQRIGRPSCARDSGRPTLVFLHEGLGCVAMWRDFPARLATRLDCPAILYSRRGYGRSSPRATPLGPDFMHRAAREELPAVLAAEGIERPVLIGHSDGGSIALIAAGTIDLHAVVTLAPHLFVESKCTEAIARLWAQARSSGLEQALGRHHDDPHATLGAWVGVWLSPAFSRWNIEPEVAAIRAPLMAIQGREDQYGTLEQIHRIARLAPESLLLELPGARHSAQFDAPERCIGAIAGFIDAQAGARR